MGQKGIYKAHVWAQCSMSFRLREPVEHLVPAEQQQNNAAKNFERREYWFQGRKPGQKLPVLLGVSYSAATNTWTTIRNQEISKTGQLSRQHQVTKPKSFLKHQGKVTVLETSLVVHRLRLHALSVWGPGLILDQGTRSHMLQLRPYAAK